MILPPDYEAEERAARRTNIEELRSGLDTPQLRVKVENWANRYGMEPEFVRYRVLTDEVFALQFAKDPAKQSLHQKVAARHIRTALPMVLDFQALPAGGRKAEYVVAGMVVSGKTLHSATSHHGKSIDFKWAHKKGNHSLQVLATHKHTKEEGGSQDNQFADVKRFLDAARVCSSPDHLFLAICDGPYYSRPQGRHTSRLEALATEYPGARVRVCTIEQLPQVLAMAIEGWMKCRGLNPSPDEASALADMKG